MAIKRNPPGVVFKLPTLALMRCQLNVPDNWREMTKKQRAKYFVEHMKIADTLDWNPGLVNFKLLEKSLEEQLEQEEKDWPNAYKPQIIRPS